MYCLVYWYGAPSSSSLSNKHHLVIMIIPGYMQHRTKLSTSLDRETWKNHKNSQISLFQSMYRNSIFHKKAQKRQGLIFFQETSRLFPLKKSRSKTIFYALGEWNRSWTSETSHKTSGEMSLTNSLQMIS